MSCPECDADVTVIASPPDRSAGIMGASIESIEGCDHVDVLLDNDQFYKEVMSCLNDAYEDEMEARYERWRDRDLDRYYRDKEN